MLQHRFELSDRRQRGFTLAEILVTTAIFAIIMIAALAIYDQSNRVFKTSAEAADMQQSTRVGFDKLVSDLRMAGFDYNRGGQPQESWQVAQPDEQIEYAGSTALVFRANFNYNTAASQGNGMEPTYTPVNVGGQSIFPYVTTSNDEIVGYVLRSSTASANTGSISFYVDDYVPRAAFPSTIVPAPAGANPSHPEELVTINNIDTTNANPPYTLYRVSVSDVHNGSIGTPVAENVRSVNFQYFTDTKGATLLTASPPGGGAITDGAIGGAGQYDPNNVGTTANFADRIQRGLIQSIRVSLVGMNASPDLQGYTNPTETIAGIKGYRQYALSSLVVPRNLGKTGFPEPTYNPPGPPTITGMCVGYCGAPVIYWQPPSVGGPVVQYQIQWDTSQNGAFNNGITVLDPAATQAVFMDDGVSDVSQQRYYRVIAQNDNGQSIPSALYAATPQNTTRPMPVSNLTATGGANRITLTWNSPTNNTAATSNLSCTGTGGSTNGSLIVPQEVFSYQIWRGEEDDFNPNAPPGPGVDNGVKVLDFFTGSQPAPGTPGSLTTWVDSATTSAFPPANCKRYYYRVRIADRCMRQANWNNPSGTANSISDFYPPLGSNAIPGSGVQGTSAITPNPPATLTIDTATPNATGCPDPQDLSSPDCRITLTWPKVNTDTANNPIAVDTYRITRHLRVQGSGNAFGLDNNFGTNGTLVVNCSTGTCSTNTFTQQSGANAGYVDFPPMRNGNGQNNEYQYTVAALGCANAVSTPPQSNDPYSLESPPATYPGCALNPTVTPSGGNTPASPLVFGSGDSITVTAGSPITSVQFDVSMWPQGTPVGGLGGLRTTSPYSMTWSNQIDNQIYMVKITITDPTPCQQIVVKYVQDQPGAPCAFSNQNPLPSGALAIPNSNASNILDTYTMTFTVPTSGTDPLQLASQNLRITWALPAGDTTHTDLKLTAVTWTVGTFTTTNNLTPVPLASPAPTVTNVATPSNVPNVPAGSSFLLQVRWQYLKSDDCASNNCTGSNPPLPALEMQPSPSPLQKVCIDYRIASEPGVTKHCNLAGQSVTSNNPNGCD